MTTLAKAQEFVGLPYVAGEFDCADLAVRVQRVLFCKDITLPAHEQGRAGQVQQIESLRYDKAEAIANPENGCGVLLARADAQGLVWHIGTVFLEGGEAWVLHNSQHLKSAALQRLGHLKRSGFTVEGFYKWK